MSAIAKGVESVFGGAHQIGKAGAGRIGPKETDQRGLAATRVLGNGFARNLGGAFRIEKIVGELEGPAERGGISLERVAVLAIGAAEDGAGLAGKAK